MSAISTVTVIGCGNMARGIASRALAGGNDVQLLDRRPEKAKALAQELSAPVSGGQVSTGQVSAGALGDPPAGDIVVLAVPYSAAAPVVQSYGRNWTARSSWTSPIRSTSPASTGWSPAGQLGGRGDRQGVSNGERIADFLANADPQCWSQETMREAMRMHLDQSLQEAVDRLQGNHAAEIEDYELAHLHILEMADLLSSGIIQEFPEKFA